MKFYLDEFKVSKMFFETIRAMKKREVSEVFVYDLEYIKYGKDFQILQKNNIIPT